MGIFSFTSLVTGLVQNMFVNDKFGVLKSLCFAKWNKKLHICTLQIIFFGIQLSINTLRPGQNGRHFADDIFKCIFLNENVWIPIKISLKFVLKGPINNIQALVQIMAWRRSGDKPLSEPMMVSLLTHICVTRPQWVNLHIFAWLVMGRWRPMTSGVFIYIGSDNGNKSLPGLSLTKHQLDP